MPLPPPLRCTIIGALLAHTQPRCAFPLLKHTLPSHLAIHPFFDLCCPRSVVFPCRGTPSFCPHPCDPSVAPPQPPARFSLTSLASKRRTTLHEQHLAACITDRNNIPHAKSHKWRPAELFHVEQFSKAWNIPCAPREAPLPRRPVPTLSGGNAHEHDAEQNNPEEHRNGRATVTLHPLCRAPWHAASRFP